MNREEQIEQVKKIIWEYKEPLLTHIAQEIINALKPTDDVIKTRETIGKWLIGVEQNFDTIEKEIERRVAKALYPLNKIKE